MNNLTWNDLADGSRWAKYDKYGFHYVFRISKNENTEKWDVTANDVMVNSDDRLEKAMEIAEKFVERLTS